MEDETKGNTNQEGYNMQVLELNSKLIDAFNAIEANKPFDARMFLNNARAIMREDADDYSDTRMAYANLEATIVCLKREGITRGSKGYLLSQINKIIQDSEDWIRMRA